MLLTDYEILERSADGKRLLRQEELLVDAQDEIALAMRQARATKADLAKALGKSRAFVTQILSSGRNLTLRTWADIATALGHRVVPQMLEDGPMMATDTANQVAEFTFTGSASPLGVDETSSAGD